VEIPEIGLGTSDKMVLRRRAPNFLLHNTCFSAQCAITGATSGTQGRI